MEGTYEVLLGSSKMGSVAVKKQGLYWHFDCRCSLSGEVMYDLLVTAGECKVKLGLLTPEKGSFCLRTKLPVKRLENGSAVFSLKPRHAEMKDKFIPVHTDEPFRYLNRLHNAYLARHNGQTGLIVQDKK